MLVFADLDLAVGVSDASPSNCSILFLSQRHLDAARELAETFSRRSWSVCQSTVTFVCLDSDIRGVAGVSKTSALWRIVFAGMRR